MRKNAQRMHLLHANAPLEFVSINILGEVIRKRRGNSYLLVITGRFSKLLGIAPLKQITAAAFAKAFTRHWMFAYAPPLQFLSDNGSQLNSRMFLHICRIMGIENLFTPTYPP